MKNFVEPWYKTVFNNNSDAIFIIDFSNGIAGKFIDINKSACKQLGFGKKELLKLSPSEIVSANKTAAREFFTKKSIEILTAKGSDVFETVCKTKKGIKFPVSVNANRVDFNGKSIIIATVKDLSKSKLSGDYYKKREKNYKDYLDKTFDGIYKLELQKPISIKESLDKQIKRIYNTGIIIECNNIYAKMYGYSSAKEAIGKSLKIIYGNKLTKSNYKAHEKFIQNGYSVEHVLTEEIDIKGNLKYFSNNAVGIIKDNLLTGSWGTQSDITEAVKTTNELKASEQKFRSIFEQSPLGILHLNNKGEIVEVNEQFVKMMGSSRKALIGFNSLKNAGNKKMRQAVREMLTKGSAYYWGEYISTTGNKKIDMKAWFTALTNENGKIIGGTAIVEDISLYVENEKKLLESEEKYKTIFNSINEGIFIYEKKSRKLIDVNNIALQMYGYTRDEMMQKNASELSSNINPYTSEEAKKYFRRVNRKTQIFEWHARRKDKSLFWIEVNMSIGKISGISRIIVSVKDITKRKEAEEELRSSEIRYRKLIHSLKDPIVVHVAGKLVFANEAALKLSGENKLENLIGRNVLDFVHPDYHEFAIKRMLNNSGSIPAVEEVFLNAQGKHLDVEVSGSRLLYKGKSAVQLIIRDITERKYNEKIQNSLFRISQAAVNSVSLDAFFKEIHLIIKSLMPADNIYIALYDRENETLTFPYFVDEFDEVVPEGTSVGNGYTAYVLKTGRSMIIDSKVEKKLLDAGKIELVGAASKIWVGVVLKYLGETIGILALQDYHNEHVYGKNEKQILTFVSEQIAQAIVKIRTDEMNRKYLRELETAKKEIEYAAGQLQIVNNELKNSEEKLKETNANKDKFFSILSHDLRSPFTALLGYSQLLEDAYFDLTEEEKLVSVRSLHKTARNIFELLTGLLEWSRTQTGTMEFEPEKIILKEIVKETISILEINASSKNIKLINKLNKNSIAFADKNMIRTVLRNLISNAIKFTKESGQIEISGKTVKGFMQICVADNGIGMKKKDMENLFRIDIHHTTLGTNNEVGTGVGLILCKELIEKNDGKIWAESKFGLGSRFIFTLKKS